MMPFDVIDHTADLGIHITAKTLPGIFETAAVAMFAQITDISKLDGNLQKTISISGADLPDLLINWLRRLLNCWTVEERLVKDVRILELNDHILSAEIFFDTYIPNIHELLTDIKAVTYCNASIGRTENGWETTVIFDV